MQLIPFLTFTGNCKTAMEFYKNCFGGELSIQYVGDTEMQSILPKRIKKFVLQATLRRGNFIITATDLADESISNTGNKLSILLTGTSEREANLIFKKLSKGGRQTEPLKLSLSGNFNGCLVDKFGVSWIVSSRKQQVMSAPA